MSSPSVFERHEKKYYMNEEQYLEFVEAVKQYMKDDEFGRSLICNIYYDTPVCELVRRSVTKPVYKEKLRLRTYGIPKDDTMAFVELKKKYHGVVYKRRISMPYKDAMEQLAAKKIVSVSGQIANEINYFLNYYKDLNPTAAVFYDREAYVGSHGEQERITIDRQIRWREEELDLSKGCKGEVLLGDGEYLMEIKIRGGMPLWLSELLDLLKIYPISYSKYGNAYYKMIQLEGENYDGKYE